MAIHWISVVIPAAVLAPNVLFFLVSPPQPPDESGSAGHLLTFLERLGQIGVFVLPIFERIDLSPPENRITAVLMAVCLAIYYTGWARYFRGEKSVKLLFSPLWGIPIPMAISPVLYFLLAAKLLSSPYVLAAGLCLGFGHIPISYKEYQRVRGQ